MSTPKPLALESLERECLFRFGVVSAVRVERLQGTPSASAVDTVAARMHLNLDGELQAVSARSIYRWLKAYKQHGIDGLRDQPQTHSELPSVLPADFVDFLKSAKEQDPAASVPEIIRRAHQHGILGPQQAVDRTSVWRACRRLELPTRLRPHKREADTRRFAHPHRMSVMLCDGKHFRAGAHRLKRVALVFLDDSSRYAIDGVVGTAESTELFLRGLWQAIRHCGFADIYYIDRGPGFRADDTGQVIARLPHGHRVHGTSAYPEGHGKIERFNQTLGQDLLRSLDGALEVDPSCDALTLRLEHYLRSVYNQRVHESLDGQTPAERFERDSRPLRFPKDEEALRQLFVLSEVRTVSPDHVIRFEGGFYEAPRGTASSQITLYRHVFSGDKWVLHQGKLVRIEPVDLARNAHDRRARNPKPASDDGHKPPPKTAATLAFERDYGPIVGHDGGFSNSNDAPEHDEPTLRSKLP